MGSGPPLLPAEFNTTHTIELLLALLFVSSWTQFDRLLSVPDNKLLQILYCQVNWPRPRRRRDGLYVLSCKPNKATARMLWACIVEHIHNPGILELKQENPEFGVSVHVYTHIHKHILNSDQHADCLLGKSSWWMFLTAPVLPYHTSIECQWAFPKHCPSDRQDLTGGFSLVNWQLPSSACGCSFSYSVVEGKSATLLQVFSGF